MTSERVARAQEILGRRASKTGVFPSYDEAVRRLAEEQALVFYTGYDPTGDNLHIGHTVSLLLLKSLARDLGHEIIILFGDFTARIGDPSEKESARRVLTEEEIDAHMQTWDRQVAALLGDVPYTIKYNSEWLSGMNFADVIKLSAKVTVQQMLVRDMFQERLKKERPIYLNEFLYPLAQGYDSVAMRVDGEVGGSEQTFNMLVGREFEKEILGKDKLVLTTPLIVDSRSGKKMSKSEGEVIAITDSPQEIRRKILDVDDGMIRSLFELCTEKEQEWIDAHCPQGAKPEDPRAAKEELAAELIRMYHGGDAVAQASSALEIEQTGPLDRVLKESNLAASLGEAKRLVEQGAVQVNGTRVTRWDTEIGHGDALQIGKGKFVKVK